MEALTGRTRGRERLNPIPLRVEVEEGPGDVFKIFGEFREEGLTDLCRCAGRVTEHPVRAHSPNALQSHCAHQLAERFRPSNLGRTFVDEVGHEMQHERGLDSSCVTVVARRGQTG